MSDHDIPAASDRPIRRRRRSARPRRSRSHAAYLRRQLKRIAPLTKLGGSLSVLPAHFRPSPSCELLRQIITGADLVTSVRVRGARFLLLTLDLDTFDRLCAFEASIEDMEDTHDAEAVDEDCDGRCDDEPSLGIWLNSSEHGVVADGEECVPLPEMAEAARARVLARVKAGKPEDGPAAIRDGRGRVVIRRPRWGAPGFELAEAVQRRARERRAPR